TDSRDRRRGNRPRFKVYFPYLGLRTRGLQALSPVLCPEARYLRSVIGKRTMSNSPTQRIRQLASDTYAGACPEARQGIAEANHGHASPYGDDPWTARATKLLQELFEMDCAVFFVGTGTAANSLALAATCQPYHSVLCHAEAHIQTDECGAPEYAGRGLK